MTHRQQSYWAVGGYSFTTGILMGTAIWTDQIGFWLAAGAMGLVSVAGIVVEGRADKKET